MLLAPGAALGMEPVTKRAGRLTIEVGTDHAHPGGLFVVRFRSRTRLGRLSAIFEGRRAPSLGSAGDERSLVPIPLTTPPGESTMGVELVLRGGRVQRMTLEVPVRPRDYPQRLVRIPEEKRALLAGPRAETDGRRLLLLVRTESEAALWSGGFRPPVDLAPGEGFGLAERHEPDVPVARLMDGTWGEEQRGLLYSVARGTPVVAPAAGLAVFAGRLTLPGLTVVLDHGQGLVSALHHLSRLDVSGGERVGAGQRLGLSGESGLAPEPRLSWRVYLHGVAVDPRAVLAGVH